MSFMLEILGRGLLTELAAAFRNVLSDDEETPTGQLRESVQQKTSTDEDYVRLGIRYLRDRDIIGAKAMFTAACAIRHDNATARIGLACALDELGRTDSAISQMQTALQSHPQDPALLFAIGYCSEHVGAIESAIKHYRASLEVCPYLQNARERLASIFVRENRLEDAAGEYEELCTAQPDDVPTILSLANLYQRLGRLGDAIERYGYALTIDPDNWDARDDLVATYDKEGLFEEAIEEMAEVIEREPAFPDNHMRLGDLYAKIGDDDAALEQYVEAVRIHPGFLEATVKIGTLYLRHGDYEESITWFNKAVELNDQLLAAYIGLGVSQYESGQQEDADETFDQAAVVEPNSTLLFSEVAKLQLKCEAERQANMYLAPISPQPATGQKKSAIGDLLDRQIERHHHALESRPNYADLHYRLGLLLRQRGDIIEAIHHFRIAVQINPRYSSAAIKLGVALREIGREDESIDVLRDALHAKPDDIALHHQLGLIFADQNKFNLAMEQFESAVRQDGRNIDLHANIALALQNMGLLDRAGAAWETLCDVAASSEEGLALLSTIERGIGSEYP